MSDENDTTNPPDQVDRLIHGARDLLHEIDSKPKPRWTLTSVSTLVALILSLGTAGWTLYEKFLSRPAPELIAPNITNIFCPNMRNIHRDYVCQQPSSLVVRAGPFVFLNHSFASNSFLISDGWVIVNFLNNGQQSHNPIKLRWQFFSDSTSSSIKRNSVSPIEVRTTAPQSREIEFTARRNNLPNGTVSFENRMLFEDFLDLVSKNTIDELRLDFRFTLYPNKEYLNTSCSILIGRDFIESAEKSKHVLYSRDCRG